MGTWEGDSDDIWESSIGGEEGVRPWDYMDEVVRMMKPSERWEWRGEISEPGTGSINEQGTGKGQGQQPEGLSRW